jgi:hypothetical protein
MVFTKGNSLLNTFSGQFSFISKKVGVVKSFVFLEMIFSFVFLSDCPVNKNCMVGTLNYMYRLAYKLGKSFKIKRSFNGVILLSG